MRDNKKLCILSSYANNVVPPTPVATACHNLLAHKCRRNYLTHNNPVIHLFILYNRYNI